MKRALIALALLGSCDQPNVGKDGYEFATPEYSRDIVELRIVTHDTATDLRASAKQNGAVVEDGRDLMAYSVLSAHSPVCTVHIVNPLQDYQPEWIGHEIAHCIYGRWHS